MTAPLRHEPDCSAPAVEFHARDKGRGLWRCPECSAWRRVRAADIAAAIEIAPVLIETPDRAEPTSRYVCRDHPDRPVTWRGRGCPDCPTSRRRTRRPDRGVTA